MSMPGYFVFVQMVVGFSLNDDGPFMKIKLGESGRGGKRAEGCVFGKNVSPLVASKAHV